MKLSANIIALLLFFAASLAATPEDHPPDPADPAESAGSKPKPAATPRPAASRVETGYSGERISFNLEDADLKDFFRVIGEISGLNFVLDPDVEGSLTLFLKEVPWDQALDTVLEQQGMGRRLSGNVLRIARLSTLEAEQQQPLAQASVAAASAYTSVLRVAEKEDQLVAIRTRIRHTTLLVLPTGEEILDFVVGDADYWHLTGSANIAYLKPLEPDVRTNVALVCASGRIYSFLAEEHEEPPHLVVRIERSQDDESKRAAPHDPAFISRASVEGYQRAARQAAEQARAASEAAAAHVEEARAEASGKIDAFRASYPASLRWPYRLEREAFASPFLVEAMWTDGRFTYLRSHAQEAPALYELKDGKPSQVAYDLSEDGLYIARHVLGPGLLRIGEKQVRWRVVEEQ